MNFYEIDQLVIALQDKYDEELFMRLFRRLRTFSN